jgi:hypothetical protein
MPSLKPTASDKPLSTWFHSLPVGSVVDVIYVQKVQLVLVLKFYGLNMIQTFLHNMIVHVFLIYLPKFPSFSTIQSYAPKRQCKEHQIATLPNLHIRLGSKFWRVIFLLRSLYRAVIFLTNIICHFLQLSHCTCGLLVESRLR